MRAIEPLPSFTFEEFLKLTQVSEQRHHWVAGMSTQVGRHRTPPEAARCPRVAALTLGYARA